MKIRDVLKLIKKTSGTSSEPEAAIGSSSMMTSRGS